MSQYTVGKDVISLCSRCKLALAGTIVVLDAKGMPGKVQCNTCKSTQKFKDPNGQVAAKKTSTRGKVGARKVAANARPHAEVWQELMNSHAGPSVKYSLNSVFNKGDVIDHPSFGLGVVERVIDSNKIEVLFKAASKTLGQNIKN